MIKIRLARHGRKHLAFYRIVAVDARNCKDSNCLGLLGTYSPTKKTLSINKEKYLQFINLGAQPSPTVHNLYKTFCKGELAKESVAK